MDFINTDVSDFLGLDLGCELNKEEIQGEIAKLSELFLKLVIEMRQKSEDQAKVLDDQDLEILDARFALDRIKTEYEFATQEQMKLTCALNEL